MPKQNVIDLFMWGYQTHFRASLGYRAQEVLKQIGLDIEPTVFLVGVRRTERHDRHPICIDPEDSRWSPATFAGIEAKIETAVEAHPDRFILYTNDEAGMRDKPENIRRVCIGEEVRRALDAADAGLGLRTFCGAAYPVDGHYVVCALQLPEVLFEQFPSIPYEWLREQHETSFLLRCINSVLADGRRVLAGPEPGRRVSGELRPAAELVREAAESFLHVPVISGEFAYSDMFREFNQLSQLMYEGRKGLGRLVLAKADDPAISYALRLREPVPIGQTRWVRKLLQMATRETVLISNYQSISGLGHVIDRHACPYSIDFLDKHEWDFRRGDQILLRVRFGEARLPQEPISVERFADNMRRLFPGVSDFAVQRHQGVLDQMTRQTHGSMVIIAEDAASEAERLELQGTRIEPTPLTPELAARASEIDGTILVDPEGLCHAIGVILDGQANERCTPSRGARYNSGVRYVGEGGAARMALVVSDDRTLDVIPLLLPRVLREPIVTALNALVAATPDNFHQPRNTLDKFRFYLSAEQCEIANAALDRIEAEPQEVGEIRWIGNRLVANPAMNESYFLD